MQDKELDVKAIVEKLETAGVQPTAQRIAIFQYLLREADHPTAEEVKAWADKNFPKMSLATVYNTLNTLVAAKLLKEFKFPHSSKVIYDRNVSKHYHFLDEETGQLIDLDPTQVEIKPKLKKEFLVNEIQLVLMGRNLGKGR